MRNPKLGKHGFRIIPKDRKMLKSSKVRKWLEYVEDIVAEELKNFTFPELCEIARGKTN